MNKNKPIRTCIACRKEFEKHELIRIVRTPEGEYTVDLTGKANGRGAYICKSEECAKKLKKSKLLNKAFKTAISDEVYALVEEALLGKQN